MDALEKREKYMRKPYKYISKTSPIMSDCHYSESKQYHSVQFNSVTQSCPTHCDPMDRSTPGFPVHHQLPEPAQTHVHRIGDAINHLIICRPLVLLPSVFPSIRVFSNESVFRYRVAKVLEFQLQHQSFQSTFRTDFL